MKFVIDIEPKPQARHRSTIKNGRISTYEDKEMKFWKKNLAYLIKSQKPECWANCALKMVITFFIRPPQYISKVKKNQEALEAESMLVMVKPDDGQVAKKSARKIYSNNHRIEFEISKI